MTQPNVQSALREAIAHHKAGRLAQAEDGYRRILAEAPQHPGALHMLGLLAFHTGNNDLAVRLIGEAISRAPDFPAAHSDLGNALLAQGRAQDAIASFHRALALQPDFPEAHNNLGNALKSAGHEDEALACYRRALAIRPDFAEAHNNAGLLLADRGRPEEAIACYGRALAARPGFVDAHNNLGNLLKAEGRLQEALQSYRSALELQPAYADAHSNLGLTLAALGRVDEALESFDRAITLRPDLAEAHWNKGITLLLKGDYAAGWPLYEWRHEAIAKRGALLPDYRQPLWLGDTPVAGRSILLHHEQGLGDTLMVLRYVPLLADRGARVILQMPPGLARLAASVPGVSEVVIEGETLPAFDLHCPMMSLPLAFRTTLETVPAKVPYVFAPDSSRMSWRGRLAPHRRRRVGLAWCGSVCQLNDQRPVPLPQLLPLLDRDAEFVSLQKEYRPEEAALMRSDGRIRDCAAYLADLAETAALIGELDLVITIDTVVAHLAGGMGKTTWVMLPFAPDFRWLLDRADSPWYPTMRLFRQPAFGDWQPVMAAVAASL
jgi:tetratricopeptide (TPR) repeat protein